MPLSECACIWEGPPSNPKLVRGCVAHLEWRNKCTKDAREEEREACAKVAEDDTSFMMLQDFGMQTTCTQVRTNIADAIRARSNKS